MYVGITTNLPHRVSAHRQTFGQNFRAIPITPKSLTEFEARAIETTLIMSNAHFRNGRLSIGQDWPFLDSAVRWASQYLSRNGIQFVW